MTKKRRYSQPYYESYKKLGQTVSLTHLAPFVNISRQKILKEVEEEQRIAHNLTYGTNLVEFSNTMKDAIKKIAEQRLREEIKRGVQTIQYQIVTLQTTNG